MLSKFTVIGFKNFGEKLELDLGHTCNYEFNASAVKNNLVNKGMIYGFNGCGKSNLGLAIMDIISHVTDKQFEAWEVFPYLNLDKKVTEASFEYTFLFQGVQVIYSYKKTAVDRLLWEKLSIGGDTVLEYDFLTNEGFVGLSGAETLKFDTPESKISRIKYIRNNAILEDTKENNIFKEFIQFADNMLLFYSLDINRYYGFKTGVGTLESTIIEAGKVQEFEMFLKDCNVDMRLSEKEIDGERKLMAHYNNEDISFYRVASKGTKALILFFYWYIQIEANKLSFVFMDEFDAFYHFELAEKIVELLKKFENTQIIFTTHNTDLLSNDLLRPDCYFWLHENKITTLSDLTEKELRKAHNLQKMFKAGAFNG